VNVSLIGYEWRWYKQLSQVRKHNVHVSSNSHVGEVSREELSVIMQCLGIKHTDLELKACVRRVDIRGKGTINFNGELCQLVW
jgi:hypothetical protein